MEITELSKLEKYAAELGAPEEVCRQLAISITAWALADIETDRDRINMAIQRSLTILAKNYGRRRA
jgi:hypothetical protein